MAVNDNEIWKPITYFKSTSSKKYAVSSHGRLASYDKNIDEKFILKMHLNGGFPMSTVHMNGKSKSLFAHHAVANTFFKKPSSKHVLVVHLDYEKDNNHFSNLKWETKAGQVEFNKKNPYILASNAHKVYTGATSKKLNEKKVIQLKTEIWNPKRKLTYKQLADKYGIAEMNLYRIKNGILWFHVHVEGEPIFAKYKAQLKNIAFHNKVLAKQQALKDKANIAKLARKNAKAEKDKKLAAAKKLKLDLIKKNKVAKAKERIAVEKRKVIRAAAAKIAKDLKLKKAAMAAKHKLLKKGKSKKDKNKKNSKKTKEKKTKTKKYNKKKVTKK